MANYDVIGNITIVKFKRGVLVKEKKKWALKFLKTHRNVTTVLEKVSSFGGRLRKQKTKFVAGVKTKEALYRENGCDFRLNVDSCYFSPRLASERLEIAKKVKRGENVLVMFGGVAPYAIVIGRNSKVAQVVSVELSRDCNKYALENVKRNRLKNVEIVQGNVRRVINKDFVARELDAFAGSRRLINQTRFARRTHKGFDRIVMARPNLRDSFLDAAFSVVKKGGVIHYYGFYSASEKNELVEMIKEEAGMAKKKIKIMEVKRAGEIGVKKFRFRVDMKVLN